MPDESHVLDFIELGVASNLTTVEWPVAIVDREERVLRNRMIPFMKVAWQYHGTYSATWEHEDLMRSSYPHLFGKCDLFTFYTAHTSLTFFLHTFTLLFTLLSQLLVLCVCLALHTSENFEGEIC